MSDKVPMPASGDGKNKGGADGVNASGARAAGGESGGAHYDNPHTGKDGGGDSSGFMGHGGQTDIGYHGGGQAGDEGAAKSNSPTRTNSGISDAGDTPTGPKDGPRGPQQDREAQQTRETSVGNRTIEVFETSGVAAAETSGKIGSEDPSSEHPGSG
ncbi:MAG: hypothetical protein JWL91_2100 [Sphingomonas bacterium]|nr:hypothetical protein [Sphingomonas bacterium]MDB5690224.1 hypothetical protein [Sphingomonas bacterium]